MKLSSPARFYGLIALLALVLIGGIVYAFNNRPAAVAPSSNLPVAVLLPASVRYSMDAGSNAPWFSDASIPVTGSQNQSFDVGAGAPWMLAAQIPVTGGQGSLNQSFDVGAGAPWLNSAPASSSPAPKDNRGLHIKAVPTSSSRTSGGGR